MAGLESQGGGGFKFSLERRVGVIQAQRMVCSYQAGGQQGLEVGKEELACPVVGTGRCAVEGWRGRICTCVEVGGGGGMQNSIQSATVENVPHNYKTLLNVWGCCALSKGGSEANMCLSWQCPHMTPGRTPPALLSFTPICTGAPAVH